MSKEDSVLKDVLNFLECNKVDIEDLILTEEVPVVKLCIKSKRDTDSLSFLLTELYKIFWVLSYGTPNEMNSSKTIDLKYRIEE